MEIFQDLLRGNRIQTVVGLEVGNNTYTFSRDYRYVELQLVPPDLGEDDKFKRNQTHILQAAGSIKLMDRHRLLAVVHPELLVYANAPGMLLIESEEEVRRNVTVPVQFRRDMAADQLPWLVRLYLLGV